jgi:hypothetical protein
MPTCYEQIEKNIRGLEPIFPLFLGRPVADCTHFYKMIIHIPKKGRKSKKILYEARKFYLMIPIS